MALVTTLAQLVTAESATAMHSLGDVYFDPMGNKFIYSKAGAAIAAAYSVLVRDEDVLEKEDADTNSAAVVYNGKTYAAKQVILSGATAWSFTAGQYAGYVGIVDDGDGVGQLFHVETNDTTQLYLRDALTTALGTSADSDIEAFSPNTVIEATASSEAQAPCGISLLAVTSAYYFWRQVAGVVPVLYGATTAHANPGIGVVSGDDTAGSTVLATTAQGPFDARWVGDIITGGDTADKPIWIQMRPMG